VRIDDVSFSGPVEVKQVRGVIFEMTTPLVCAFTLSDTPAGFPLRPGNRYRITVPEGFRHDFASTPWPLRKIGRHASADVVHDWCYENRWPEDSADGKAFADLLFLEGMKATKVDRWKRNLMYLAVVVFGGRAWRT